MAEALQIARFFIDLAEQQYRTHTGERMTALRLQKLMYFAQGWYMSRYGTPLFNEDMEAWKYGPVIPSVYQRYKEFQDGPIHDIPPEKEAFTQSEYALLLDVARDYWKYSSSELVRMSHAPDSPWRQVYRDGKKNLRVSKESIREYFLSMPDQLKTMDDRLSDFKKRASIYTAEAGTDRAAILPREVTDDWEY